MRFLSLCFALAAGVSLHAGVIGGNGFTLDAEGWTALSANPLVSGIPVVQASVPIVYQATGGNGDGYISVADPDSQDTLFVAPSVYHGNIGDAVNGILRFDLLYNNSSLSYDGPDLVFKGGGKTLIYDVPIPPLSASWVTFSVLLAPSSNWRLDQAGGPLATLADFNDVFQNLTDFWILAEFTNGIVEVTGLDNASIETLDLADTPEPSTISLFLASGLAVWAWRRRSGA